MVGQWDGQEKRKVCARILKRNCYINPDVMAKWNSVVRVLTVLHADREHGMKWKVLSKEIKKMITIYYLEEL